MVLELPKCDLDLPLVPIFHSYLAVCPHERAALLTLPNSDVSQADESMEKTEHQVRQLEDPNDGQQIDGDVEESLEPVQHVHLKTVVLLIVGRQCRLASRWIQD